MTEQEERDAEANAKGHPPVADKVACVDFDGTIKPWAGGLFGFIEPFPGAVEAVKRLKAAGYKVVIFTSRLSQTWHEAEGWDHHEAVEQQVEYLRKYCAMYGIDADAATAEKIPSEAYFDDKAFTVDGQTPLLSQVGGFLGGVGEREAAYLAGFFDGEGCVGVYAYERKAGNNGGGAAGSLTVSATQKVREPLEMMMLRWGGSIRQDTKGLFVWKASGAKAALALREMLPYLVVKRRQAELAIEFQSLLRARGGVRLTEEEKSRRLELVTAIKAEKVVSASAA